MALRPKYRGDGWVSRSDEKSLMFEAWFHALACSQAVITLLLGSNHSAPRLLRGALKSEARVWLIAEIFIPKYFCTYIDRIKETWIIDLTDGRIWGTQWYVASLAIICELHNNCLTLQENKENGVMGDDILIDFGPVEAYNMDKPVNVLSHFHDSIDKTAMVNLRK